MERWWFRMIAGPDGKEAEIRVILRTGDDESSYPAVQVRLDGTEVAVDDAAVDYEAPEWKAKQLFAAGGGGGDGDWEDVLDHVRSLATG